MMMIIIKITKICNTQKNSECRLCDKRDEMVYHMLRICTGTKGI